MPFLDLKNKKCWMKSFASLQYIIITMCNIYIYILSLVLSKCNNIYCIYIIYISFYLFIFLQIKILKIKPLINSFFYKFLDFYES